MVDEIKNNNNNNQERVNELNRAFHEEYKKATESHSNCSCSLHALTLENVLDASFSLGKGKCADDAQVNAKHFFNTPLSHFDRLQLLFSKMLLHGYVLYQFQRVLYQKLWERRLSFSVRFDYRSLEIIIAGLPQTESFTQQRSPTEEAKALFSSATCYRRFYRRFYRLFYRHYSYRHIITFTA